MRTYQMVAVIILSWTSLASAADAANETEAKTWTVTARAVESPFLKHRLLPAEYELRDGNAATILLRLPWDQVPYWTQVVPKFSEQLTIPLSDTERIRKAGPGLYENLFYELRRAAYRRTADWEYPLDEKPLSGILLPDVQGSRDILARGLSVWIRYHIAGGQLDEAREGLLVGLANARHYARTPFAICRLVAVAHVNAMLDRLEELIQQPECPDLYWALTALPTPLVDMRPALEFQMQFLPSSVPGIDDLDQPRSPDAWQELAARTIRFLQSYGPQQDMSHEQMLAAQQRMAAMARRELPKLQPSVAETMTAMTDAELAVRWAMARWIDLYERVVAAAALETPVAIRRLRKLDEDSKYLAENGAWFETSHFAPPWRAYLSAANLERRIAALRIVEGIRHFAATHDGKLPKGLNEMTDTPAPVDPLTGKPFDYKADADSFRLTAEDVEISETSMSRINLHVRVQSAGTDSTR